MDIRCRNCKTKLAEQHGQRIEIKMGRRGNVKHVTSTAPVEIVCEKCGSRNKIIDTSHRTEPVRQPY